MHTPLDWGTVNPCDVLAAVVSLPQATHYAADILVSRWLTFSAALLEV